MTDFHDIKKYKRFKKAVESLNVKFENAEISKKTGHSKANVSKYLNGKLEPSENFYNDFQKSFNIDIDNFNDENMDLKALVSEPNTQYKLTTNEEKFKLIEDYNEIPEKFRNWVKPFYPDMKVGAGFEMNDYRSQTKYYLLVPFSERVEFWAPVEGVSMFPKYNSNDIVGLAEIFLDDVFPGNDYVVDLKRGKSHLKRIEFLKDNPEKISLCSYNPEHGAKEMDLEKISKFFKVKMHINYQ